MQNTRINKNNARRRKIEFVLMLWFCQMKGVSFLHCVSDCTPVYSSAFIRKSYWAEQISILLCVPYPKTQFQEPSIFSWRQLVLPPVVVSQMGSKYLKSGSSWCYNVEGYRNQLKYFIVSVRHSYCKIG